VLDLGSPAALLAVEADVIDQRQSRARHQYQFRQNLCGNIGSMSLRSAKAGVIGFTMSLAKLSVNTTWKQFRLAKVSWF
jgi:hypothetical protein